MYSMRNQIRTVGDSKQSKDDDFMRTCIRVFWWDTLMCMELLNRLQFVNRNTYKYKYKIKIKMKTKIKLEQVHGAVKSVASSRQLLRSAPHALLLLAASGWRLT